MTTDPLSGLSLHRIVGGDAVVIWLSPSGPASGPITFFHATSDCSDSRYFPIAGGAGFAFYASVHGGTVFYTKAMDPTWTVQIPILATETLDPGADPALPGVCTAGDGGAASLGVVTMASDPVLANLALPLRLK